jgi:hypothetical protein
MSKFGYAQCHYAEFITLNAIMLNAIMLNVIMLNVTNNLFMLSVVVPREGPKKNVFF